MNDDETTQPETLAQQSEHRAAMARLDRKFGATWRDKAERCANSMAAYHTRRTMIGYETRGAGAGPRSLWVYAITPAGDQIDLQVQELPYHIGIEEQKRIRAALFEAAAELERALTEAGIPVWNDLTARAG